MTKRKPLSSRKRMSSDAVELGRLAAGIAESGSRLEKQLLETQAYTLVEKLLHNAAEEELVSVLDRLFDANADAHDALADIIESKVESCVMTHNGQEYDVLLFNVPLLAWSRFTITSGSIASNTAQTLKTLLATHIFSTDAQIVLTNYLFSPDQLPRSFVDTWQLMRTLGGAALCKSTPKLDLSTLPPTNAFLSDTRYLIGAVAVPKGSPIFRWNIEESISRDLALKEWVKHASTSFEALLPGSAFQPLLADAYHAACWSADMALRPYSLRASVAFLQTTLGIAAENLRAVVGGFHDNRLEEYRISFGPRDSKDIFHGVTWPLLDQEDENTEVISQIEAVLLESGVKEIFIHHQQFPFEFCDDCGAPLYPDIEGDTVHAELPESINLISQTLH